MEALIFQVKFQLAAVDQDRDTMSQVYAEFKTAADPVTHETTRENTLGSLKVDVLQTHVFDVYDLACEVLYADEPALVAFWKSDLRFEIATSYNDTPALKVLAEEVIENLPSRFVRRFLMRKAAYALSIRDYTLMAEAIAAIDQVV